MVQAADLGNQPGFIHDDHVIEALASKGSDKSLRIRVLPWGTRGGAEFLDAHVTRGGRERGERVVAIVKEIAWSRVFGKTPRGVVGRSTPWLDAR